MKSYFNLMFPLIVILFAAALNAGDAGLEERVKRIAFTLNIASAEYALGVSKGRVVNPVEYQEAQDFSSQAKSQLERLSKEKNFSDFETGTLIKDLNQLTGMINAKVEPRSVRTLVEKINLELETVFGVSVRPIPKETPSLANGKKIYGVRCAICHGAQGDGAGPAAPGINPKPAGFRDIKALTPSEFWQVSTVGVEGTAMISWADDLTEQERWDVVSYLWQLSADPKVLDLGKKTAASFNKNFPDQFKTKEYWAQTSDEDAAKALQTLEPALSQEHSEAAARFLRLNLSGENLTAAAAHTQNNAKQAQSLAQTRATITRALELYTQGAKAEAAETVLEGYLHYEGLEKDLRIHQPEINQRLEPAFASLRSLMNSGASQKDIDELAARMLKDLDAVKSPGQASPPWTIFLQSLAIILREGMEAILILAAIAAYLRRAGHAAKVHHVFSGAGAAVLASFVTAWAMEKVFRASKLDQEALEGLTMLTAVVVLFYVSNWMLSKIEIKRWQEFIQGKVQGALSSKNIMALSAAAFLAVYREGFETVLFYKALSGMSTEQTPIWGGFLIGSVILAAIFWGLERFGYKIPLKKFFIATSAFLLAMTFSFMGKGIAELQEAGWLPATPVSWAPNIPLLGIFPTWETLAGQFVVLAALVVSMGWLFYFSGGAKPRLQEQKSR